jgi:hypothetical protein
MSGKTIVFNTEVVSPIFGAFKAGDVGRNMDADFAKQMVDAKLASYGSGSKAESDEALDKAGKLTSDRSNAGPSGQRAEFNTTDEAQMRKAGVIRGNDEYAKRLDKQGATVGGERTAERMEQGTLLASDGAPGSGESAIAAAAARKPAATAPAKSAKVGKGARAVADSKMSKGAK